MAFVIKEVNRVDILAICDFRNELNGNKQEFIDHLKYTTSFEECGKLMAVFVNDKIVAMLEIFESEINFSFLDNTPMDYIVDGIKLFRDYATNNFEFNIYPNSNLVDRIMIEYGFTLKGLNKYVFKPKILVFNGSPKQGTSYFICNELKDRYANVEIINAYDHVIKPCTDCGFCSINACQCIYDDMDGIYEKIANAQIIIIVSPVHVGSVSAPLLAMFSRLQIYFANKFILKQPFPFAPKKGYGIAISGNNWNGQEVGLRTIMQHALKEMNCSLEKFMYLTNSDRNTDYNDIIEEMYVEVDKYGSKKTIKDL